MKKLICLNFIIVLLMSPVCFSWEIQKSRACKNVGLQAERYSLCFPEHYFVDRVGQKYVDLSSSVAKTLIVFRYDDYTQLLEADQEGGEMKFKTKANIGGEIVYIHHFPFPGSDITTYTWTVVIEEGELYMQLIGQSEQEVSALFAEIMSSKKLH